MKNVLAIRHVKIEDLGIFEPFLKEKGFKIIYLDIPEISVPPEPEEVLKDVSFLFVLGGYMGVYENEKYPFLNWDFLLVEKALNKNIPLIGICLGAQILAHVLGAKVYKGEKGKEIGWMDVFKVNEHPYFSGFPERFKVFQLHGDTFDLPEGAQLIYSSGKYPNQAFVYNRAIGLQFHIEVDKKIALSWGNYYRADLKKNGIDIKEFKKISDEELNILKNCAKSLIEKLTKAKN